MFGAEVYRLFIGQLCCIMRANKPHSGDCSYNGSGPSGVMKLNCKMYDARVFLAFCLFGDLIAYIQRRRTIVD